MISFGDDRIRRPHASQHEATSRLGGTVLNHQPAQPTLFANLASLPEDRKQLIFRVRRQIAENTYETPEKIEAAFERLLGSIEDHFND